MATTMTYGSYSFSPVPLVTINKNYLTRGDGERIGVSFAMSLDGTLTPLATGVGGITNTVNLLDDLRAAFVQDGCAFVIQCDDNVLWSGNPRVNNFNFDRSNNNWVDTIPYTIQMEFDVESSNEDSSLPIYIQEFNESWSLSFAEESAKFDWVLPTVGQDTNPYILNMTHEVNAKGKRHYSSCGTVEKQAWEYAKDYVASKLSNGGDTAFNTELAGSGIINLNTSLFTAYNHMRVQQNDIANGTYGITENWIVMNTGAGIPGHALEDFTVNVQQNSDTDLTSVTVDGSIQGVETRSYGTTPNGFSITETKYTAASGYWSTVASRLYYRAQLLHTNAVASKTYSTRSLNTKPLSTNIGHSPTKGFIQYSYTYDDRPSNCITGALSEVINISDKNPNDVFASIMVLGRALGPVLQDIGTITESSRDISIEVVCPPVSSCTASALRVPPNNVKTDIATLLCGFETELTGTYEQVFKTQDTESWMPKEGRYSRTVGWTYQGCSITRNTSLC